MNRLDSRRPQTVGPPNVRVYIESEHAALRYHVRERIVHHEFKRFVRGAHFREVLRTGLDVFRRHCASKWLSDDRGNSAITPADGEWAKNEWAPEAVLAGWKYWAVVLPENPIGQMNMARRLRWYAERGVVTQVFSNPADAFAWLEQQK